MKKFTEKSMPSPKIFTRECALLFFVAAAATFLIDLRLRGLAADDSYIHFRIAQHLLETGNAFFNTNERVMVTSSPVWTLLLAVSSLCFRQLPPAIPLEALGVGLAVTAAFLLARTYSSLLEMSGFSRILYLFFAPAITFALLLQSSIEQMEAPIAVALLLIGTLLFSRRNRWWLCVLMLAGFTRYEYLAAAVCILLLALVFRVASRAAALLGIATLVFGLAYLMLQYGTVTPNTVHAKAVGYVLSYSYVLRQLGFGLQLTGMMRLALIAILIVAVLVRRYKLAGARLLLEPDALVIGAAGLAAAYVLRKAYVFPWYLPLVQVPLALGLILEAPLLGTRWLQVIAFGTALILLPEKSLRYEAIAAVTGRPVEDQADSENLRVKEYLAVGRAIQKTCPQARFLTSEIGGLGVAFHGTIFDGFGLASPAAIKFHPMAVPEDRQAGDVGAIPVGFVHEVRPDIIVSYSTFAQSLMKKLNAAEYTRYAYAPLPASLSGTAKLWPAGSTLYVWFANAGSCPAAETDREIHSSLAAN